VLLVASTAVHAAQELAPGQGWQIAGAFPKSEPGPLERDAKPITPENPIPRRTRLVRPPYPPEAAAVGVRASVTLRLTLDHLGTVREARAMGVPILGAIPPGTPPDERAFTAGLLALVQSAKDAVALWLYDPPADAPIAFDVVIGFSSEGDGEVIAQTIGSGRTVPSQLDAPGATPATKVKHVTPVYPAAAREAKIAGLVILEAQVDTDGRVSEVRVVRSIPELDDAAIEAVKQWEYTPRRIGGVATPVTMTLTIQFSLP
jgi:TonB family protein